jgi:uncharacterized protein (TIGR03032 family)
VAADTYIELLGRQPEATEGFSAWLEAADCSLLFLAGGRVWTAGRDTAGRIAITEVYMGQTVTALSHSDDRLLVAGWQVWLLPNAVPHGDTSPEGHDRVFLPQAAVTVGDVGIVDIAFAGQGLDGALFGSSRLGCLATIHPRWSFTVKWTPAWQTAVTAEDRAHLGGFCTDGEGRTWVALAGRSDEPGGWRQDRVGGGLVTSTTGAGEVLCDGLTMPRVPRVEGDSLLLPDAGSGRLLTVDLGTGEVEEVRVWSAAPSAVDVHGGVAVVGLSSPRIRDFEDLPAFDGQDTAINDALVLVDLGTGDTLGRLDLHGRGGGISAVVVLPGVRWPEVAVPRSPAGRSRISLGPPELLVR